MVMWLSSVVLVVRLLVHVQVGMLLVMLRLSTVVMVDVILHRSHLLLRGILWSRSWCILLWVWLLMHDTPIHPGVDSLLLGHLVHIHLLGLLVGLLMGLWLYHVLRKQGHFHL